MNEAILIEKYFKLLDICSAYDNVYYRSQLEKYPTISPSVSREDGYLEMSIIEINYDMD